MMKEMRYDYDELNRYKALCVLSKLVEYPLQIRYSSSGKLHVKTFMVDPLLKNFDEERQKYGKILSFSLLFDVKFGKRSGSWVWIRNLIDLMNFLY